MPIIQMGQEKPAEWGRRSPQTRRVEHVKRFRALAIITAMAAIVAIPGAAQARGQDNCIAETVQMLKTTFHADPGSAAAVIEEARTNPDVFPWCG